MRSEIAILFGGQGAYAPGALAEVPSDDVGEVLRAVDAARQTERLHAAHGIPREEAHLQHGLLASFLEKTFSILGAEHRAFGLFAPVLRNTNPALLTGLAVGGAMAYALKKKSPSKRKEG